MYKIFIVEDDEAIANAVRKSLEAWDYEVKCCGDFRNVPCEFSEFLLCGDTQNIESTDNLYIFRS